MTASFSRSLFCLTGGLLLLVTAGLWAVESRARREGREGIQPAARDADAAAAILRSGARAMVATGEDSALYVKLAVTPAEAWTDEDRAAVLGLLARNSQALELFDEVADLRIGPLVPAGYDPRDSLDPELTRFISAAKLLLLSGKLDLAGGDRSGAERTAETLAHLATAIEGEPWLIYQLVGRAAEDYYLCLVKDLLRAGGEASWQVEVSQNLEELEALSSPKRWLAAEASLAREGRERGGVDLSGSYHRLNAVADRPSTELVGWFDNKSWRSSQRRTPDGMVADLLFPNFQDALVKQKATAAERLLARLAIAARSFEQEHGRFPADLAQLGLAVTSDPVAGGSALMKHGADGSLELSLPHAAAVLRSAVGPEPIAPSLLVWRLNRSD